MKQSTKKLLKAALQQRGSNTNLFFILRWIYTIKLIICVLLERSHDFAPRQDLVRGVAHIDKQRIAWHPDPTVHFWLEYAVGRGLFKNWYYDSYPESTPEGQVPEEKKNDPAENGDLQGLQ